MDPQISVIPVVLALLFLAPTVTGTADLEVLYVGDPFGSSPYFALALEPGIQLTPVPAFVMANSYPKSWGKRLMRKYSPRSYEELARFNVILLSDVRLDLFSSEDLEWISDLVLEGGSGLAMIGGLDSYSGVGENSWYSSPVGPVLPVFGGAPNWLNARISWSDDDDPFMASLPFDELGEKGTFSGFNLVEARPGSSTVATLESQLGSSPLITYWEVGNGIGFAFATEWKGDTLASFCRTPEECHLRGTCWGNQFASWGFAPEFARNVIYLLARRPFPDDPAKSKIYLTRNSEYHLDMSLALLQIEVLDRLGVPTRDVEDIIDGARASYGEARELYESGLLDDSIQKIDEALSELSRAGPTSSCLEEEHLMWMYLIQVAAVTSAGIIVGLAYERVTSSNNPSSWAKNREE